MVNLFWEEIVSVFFDVLLFKCFGIIDFDLDYFNKIQLFFIIKNIFYLSVDLLSIVVLIERGLWKKVLSDF